MAFSIYYIHFPLLIHILNCWTLQQIHDNYEIVIVNLVWSIDLLDCAAICSILSIRLSLSDSWRYYLTCLFIL